MKRSRAIAIRFLAALACGTASAMFWSAATADGSPDFAAIDRYVLSEMDTQRIPGLALGIVHGDRVVHVRGFGQSDAEAARPIGGFSEDYDLAPSRAKLTLRAAW
jgi:CubicO group peptidase (beta-lactamase class C family)